MSKQEESKMYVQIDAETAAFLAVNEKRIYPFRSREFILGFMEGRLSAEGKHEKLRLSDVDIRREDSEAEREAREEKCQIEISSSAGMEEAQQQEENG